MVYRPKSLLERLELQGDVVLVHAAARLPAGHDPAEDAAAHYPLTAPSTSPLVK